MLSCDKIRVDGFNFDLSHLAGPHSVLTSRYESIPKTHHNTTYTLDLCKPLQKSGKEKATEECPNGTRGESVLGLLAHPFPSPLACVRDGDDGDWVC